MVTESRRQSWIDGCCSCLSGALWLEYSCALLNQISLLPARCEVKTSPLRTKEAQLLCGFLFEELRSGILGGFFGDSFDRLFGGCLLCLLWRRFWKCGSFWSFCRFLRILVILIVLAIFEDFENVDHFDYFANCFRILKMLIIFVILDSLGILSIGCLAVVCFVCLLTCSVLIFIYFWCCLLLLLFDCVLRTRASRSQRCHGNYAAAEKRE